MSSCYEYTYIGSNMKNKHIIQLDGLRFFAVLMVMIAHWIQWQWTNPIAKSIPFVHGVTLFFVLSGFLITRILLQNRDKYNSNNLNKAYLVKNFYIRRFFRIFPIYYLLIIGLFIIDYKNTHELFPWLVTYTSNIYQSINNVYIGDFNHFWSLAVEEQFYLFWPFVILFIKPNRTRTVIIFMILLALITKVFLFVYVGKWMATSYFTLCSMHALGLGALLAYITMYNPTIKTSLSKPKYLYITLILYIGSLIVQNSYNVGWYKEIFDDFFFAILASFIILRASNNGFKGFAKLILENRFVTYSGKVSYGLYVYHLFMPPLFYYLAPKIGLSINNKYTFFIALYLLTFIISHISWKLIESPINKLKDRVPYLKSVKK